MEDLEPCHGVAFASPSFSTPAMAEIERDHGPWRKAQLADRGTHGRDTAEGGSAARRDAAGVGGPPHGAVCEGGSRGGRIGEVRESGSRVAAALAPPPEVHPWPRRKRRSRRRKCCPLRRRAALTEEEGLPLGEESGARGGGEQSGGGGPPGPCRGCWRRKEARAETRMGVGRANATQYEGCGR